MRRLRRLRLQAKRHSQLACISHTPIRTCPATAGFGLADCDPRLAKIFLNVSAAHYPERLGTFFIVSWGMQSGAARGRFGC